MLALAPPPPPSTTATANFPKGKAQTDMLHLGLRYLFFDSMFIILLINVFIDVF